MEIFDRESRQTRAKAVSNTRRETLQREILNGVKFGSRIYTDEAVGYDTLKAKYVQTVNHIDYYVRSQVPNLGAESVGCKPARTHLHFEFKMGEPRPGAPLMAQPHRGIGCCSQTRE